MDRSGADWDDLIAAARALAETDGRRVLGITGAPGAGKSGLAEALANALVRSGARVALVAMDGFHLAGAELTRLGRTDRKGAPDTFDVYGYVNLLRRVRSHDEPVVYAPFFDRALDEPIGSSVAITADISLVITEGNYLLLPTEGWAAVGALLDQCWYVDLDEQVRLTRLIDRHMLYGRTLEQAQERALGSDQRNADVVAGTRRFATRIVVVPDTAS
jgi:pantothenate kinase